MWIRSFEVRSVNFPLVLVPLHHVKFTQQRSKEQISQSKQQSGSDVLGAVPDAVLMRKKSNTLLVINVDEQNVAIPISNPSSLLRTISPARESWPKRTALFISLIVLLSGRGILKKSLSAHLCPSGLFLLLRMCTSSAPQTGVSTHYAHNRQET